MGKCGGSELHHELSSVLHTYTCVHTHVFIQNHIEDYKFGENSEVCGKPIAHLLFPYLQLITFLTLKLPLFYDPKPYQAIMK